MSTGTSGAGFANTGGELTEREKDVSWIPAMSQTGRCESGLGQNGWRC